MSHCHATTSSSGVVLSYPMAVARNYDTCRDMVVVQERLYCHNDVSSVPEHNVAEFLDVRSEATDDGRYNSKVTEYRVSA